MPAQRKRLEASTISVKVADALREAIVRGELKPGESITQDSVAQLYSVSTMPVREALLALSKEGMIDARPNRGFHVVRMAQQDVEDIYWAQGVVAGRLTRKACELRSASLVSELAENFANMQAALAVDDADEGEYLSRQFHRAINLAADSPKLLALLKMMVNQIPRLFYTKLLQGNEWGHVNLEQHAALLAAFRKGNARSAETIAVDHVATAGRLMVEYIAAQGYWDEPADGDR